MIWFIYLTRDLGASKDAAFKLTVFQLQVGKARWSTPELMLASVADTAAHYVTILVSKATQTTCLQVEVAQYGQIQ